MRTYKFMYLEGDYPVWQWDFIHADTDNRAWNKFNRDHPDARYVRQVSE